MPDRGRIGLADVFLALSSFEGASSDRSTKSLVAHCLGYHLLIGDEPPKKLPHTVLRPLQSEAVHEVSETVASKDTHVPVPMLRTTTYKTQDISISEKVAKIAEVRPEKELIRTRRVPRPATVEAQWSSATYAPKLYTALRRKHTASKSIDVERVVRMISRAELIRKVPLKPAWRHLGRLQVIVDRAWRLAPAWSDGEQIADWLTRWGAAQDVEVIYARRADPEWPSPSPGLTSVYVTDAGVFTNSKVSEAWMSEGKRRAAAGEHALLMSIYPLSPEQTHEAKQVGWEVVTSYRRMPRQDEEMSAWVDKLLAVASLSYQVEAPMLRELRQLLGMYSPAIEVQAWTQTEALCSGSLSTAQWVSSGWQRYRAMMIAAAREGDWFTAQTMVDAIQCIASYRVSVLDAELKDEQHWVASYLWHADIASWRSLATKLPKTHKEALLDFLHTNKLEEKNVTFLNNVSADIVHAEHRSQKDRLLNYLDVLKRYESREVWAQPNGVLFSLAAALSGTLSPLDRLFSFGPRGLQVSSDAGSSLSPVVTLPGAGDSLLEVGGQCFAVMGKSSAPVDLRSWALLQNSYPQTNWGENSGTDQFGIWASVDVNGVELKFRWIEPGTFWMGSPDEDDEAFGGEKPRHQVTLTQGYWLAETPCTQALWQAVTDKNPSQYKGESRPVENVSWDDVQAFLQQLNQQAPGLDVQPPTEAQWEYACRAGTEMPRYGELDAIAWYSENSGDGTHPVGEKQPNAWGLYDMLGNVDEWCRDGLRDYAHSHDLAMHGAVIDPMGPMEEGARRVLRGGGWYSPARGVRAAYRSHVDPASHWSGSGFRLSRGHSAPSQSSSGPGRPKQVTEVGGPGSGGTPGQGGARGIRSGITLVTDRAEAQLDIFERPAWASYIGRDEFGLYAKVRVQKNALVPLNFRMRWIPPGEFMMGSPENEEGRGSDELLHPVRLTQGYWLADVPCTQALWVELMDNNPSWFKDLGVEHPVEQVSWNDIQEFLKVLNRQVPGLEARLPSEAQWEYACRAGSQTPRYGELEAVAWYDANSKDSTRPVGTKAANVWGLYDTLGNVWEWCHDVYGPYDHSGTIAMHTPLIDPMGPMDEGTARVLRGGSWYNPARYVRAAYRNHYAPANHWAHSGFRLSRGHSAPSQWPGRPYQNQIASEGRPGSRGTRGLGGDRGEGSTSEPRPGLMSQWWKRLRGQN